MIRLKLEYKGYAVEITERAEKALDILRVTPIGLLIMDILLSGANGTDVCRQVKQNPNTSSLPVIMISAHPHARQLCLAAGADEFIARPFDMHELLESSDTIFNK
jgi:DNA-binding response OmpR family regulator